MYMHVAHLLFKVSSLFFINQDQVEVVPHTELFIDVLHGRREVIAGQKQANGNGLPSDRSSIHDLILGYLLILCVDVWSCGGGGE